MIDKLIFLYHGGGRHGPPIAGTYTIDPITGLIVVGLLIISAVGLWMYFTRKRFI